MYFKDIVYTPKDKPEIGVLDESETLKNSNFPLEPEKLLALTKQLLSPEAEFGSKNPGKGQIMPVCKLHQTLLRNINFTFEFHSSLLDSSASLIFCL